jgi:hypothetical protein
VLSGGERSHLRGFGGGSENIAATHLFVRHGSAAVQRDLGEMRDGDGYTLEPVGLSRGPAPGDNTVRVNPVSLPVATRWCSAALFRVWDAGFEQALTSHGKSPDNVVRPADVGR